MRNPDNWAIEKLSPPDEPDCTMKASLSSEEVTVYLQDGTKREGFIEGWFTTRSADMRDLQDCSVTLSYPVDIDAPPFDDEYLTDITITDMDELLLLIDHDWLYCYAVDHAEEVV